MWARPSRLLSVLLLLPLLPLSAQPPGEAALAKRIEEIINRGDAAKAFWGIEVFSPARGRTLYSLNAHRYFIP
ncbi:MAG: D-alanyl-D-alanine carboxypeptidase/D-alanyl-D-alanine-endopeptidase, partial [Acidobacteria bacterium]|nr:D-alanyl-D-alanine carboxypeptidase/D-alanyl-D-alanine-endopeptidase [Acidobacteriota bacterium]